MKIVIKGNEPKIQAGYYSITKDIGKLEVIFYTELDEDNINTSFQHKDKVFTIHLFNNFNNETIIKVIFEAETPDEELILSGHWYESLLENHSIALILCAAPMPDLNYVRNFK